MKYKVGDKVRVRKDLVVDKKYGGIFLFDTMSLFKGKLMTIKKIDDEGFCNVKENGYHWSIEMFEPLITNLDKVKEEIDIKDVSKIGNPFCQAVHRVRDEENCIGMRCDECAKWLKQPYKEPSILDEAEKKYLSDVVRPFRCKIYEITKRTGTLGEYIIISIKDDTNIIFPYFEKGTMYKGMELNKQYTLDELGL